MIVALAARVGAEARGAGVGIARLARRDPAWVEAFDLTADGFLRSFVAPLIALPFSLVVAAAMNRAGAASGAPQPLWAAGAAHVFDSLAYPLALGLLARTTGIGAGYAAFIVVTNWVGLFLSVGLAALALPLLVTGGGLDAFASFGAGAFCVAVWLTWRAGRETLSGEVAPVLMAVLLLVGVSALADQLAAWLSGVGVSG